MRGLPASAKRNAVLALFFVCKQYGVLQTQVSTWRTKGFGKTKKRASTGKRTKASGRILSNYKQVKATLLARKRELEAELKEINTALKG